MQSEERNPSFMELGLLALNPNTQCLLQRYRLVFTLLYPVWTEARWEVFSAFTFAVLDGAVRLVCVVYVLGWCRCGMFDC